MAVVLRIDEKSEGAKLLLAYVKTLPFVSIQGEGKMLNAETEKVIADARKGKGVTRVKNYKNLVAQLVK